jgi:hypothetical protein
MATKTTSVNPDRRGVIANELLRILIRLKEDTKMKELYNNKILDNIAVVADNNDLRIEDAGKKDLTAEDKKAFLKAIDKATTET